MSPNAEADTNGHRRAILKKRLQRVRPWELVIVIGAVFSVILFVWTEPYPYSLASREALARSTCPGLVCPLRCSEKQSSLSDVDQDRFKAMVGLISKLPTFNLSSYSKLIQHWELVRELVWMPSDRRSELIPIEALSDANAVRRRDLSLLVEGAYLRAQPPPSYQRAVTNDYNSKSRSIVAGDHWSTPLLDPDWASNPRVRAILHTFLASEMVQVSLGQVISRNQAPPPDTERRARSVKNALLADPGYFYAQTSAALLSTIDASGDESMASKGHRAAHMETIARLDQAMSSFLKKEWNQNECRANPECPAKGHSPRNLLPTSILSKCNPFDLTVYIVYLNDVLEEYSALMDSTGKTPQGADETRMIVRDGMRILRSKEIPPSIVIRLDITALEYDFVRSKVTPRDESAVRAINPEIRFVLGRLCATGGDDVDGYDGLYYLNHLRGQSEYLRGLWLPGEFDMRVCTERP
jgi:hypothetical protein